MCSSDLTRAIRALKITDEAMDAMARDERLHVLEPDRGTYPRVYYRNLEPVLTHFIGGNVTLGGANAEGAAVHLLMHGKKVATAQTDAFGDFRFDGITLGGGDYAIKVSHRDGEPKNVMLEGGITESRVIAIELA